MKKLTLGLAMVALAACSKDVPNVAPPTVVVARFDPSANPPVVPAPNDLATDPTTGKLDVTTAVTPADQEFAAYLNTLNGFPADTPGLATFSGRLDPASVSATTVRVYDITDPNARAAVPDATAAYGDQTIVDADGNQVYSPTAPGLITVLPPSAGWTPGHSYAIALVGGSGGLKGHGGEPVVGSTTWALIRSSTAIATCPTKADGTPDLTSTSCRSNTGLIPSQQTGEAARVQDQGQTAAVLEGLRLHYAPTLDYLETQGVARNDVALLFTFRVADHIVTPEYLLDADPCVAQVPVPNDLAISTTTGLVGAPVGCPGQSDSESEFNADYVNHLNGFPTAAEGGAKIVGGDLDASTVVLDTDKIVFLDLTALPDGGTSDVQPAAVHYDATSHQISIDPPAAGWPKGHDFAVALLSTGIHGSNGEDLVASDQFALVRSSSTLVSCADDSDPTTCTSALTLAPLSDAQAVQLEQVRLALKPVFDLLSDQLSIDRADVAALWTFKIFDNPEMNFVLDPLNPANSSIPFPFDGRALPVLGTALEFYAPGDDGGAGHINGAQFGALGAGLGTLDGFSTSAPIVTSFGTLFPRDLIDTTSNVDPGTLTAANADDGGSVANVGVINLTADGEAPQFHACVNCGKASNYLIPTDGGSPQAADLAEPEQLAIVPDVPLAEKSYYGGYVTIGVADQNGKGVAPSSTFALLRMKNPIVDAEGNILIPGLQQAVNAGLLSSTQLAVVELAREAYQSFFDGMDAAGYPRGQLALAWDFHTQTTWSALPQLHGYPSAVQQSPSASFFPTTVAPIVDATSAYSGVASGKGLPFTHVGKVIASSFATTNLLRQANGTYGPFSLTTPTPEKVPLLVYLPSGTAPAGGWPVLLFGHGITRSKNDSIALADAANAAGFALVTFDELFHGDRTTCIGAAVALTALNPNATDDLACQAPSGGAFCDEAALLGDNTTPNPLYGRCLGNTRTVACDATSAATGDAFCQAQNLGDCAYDGFCEGGHQFPGADGTPVLSGWNFIDLGAINTQFFFPSRDHFRQDVVDLGQLELVLADATSAGLNAQLTAGSFAKLDATQVHYIGQSLGGILGTLYTSATTLDASSVLNVPGGNLAELLLTAPNLASLRDPLLSALSTSGYVPGTPAFDQFITLTTWVMDPADPSNAANHMLDLNPSRKVLVQYIKDDQTVPNPNNEALIASANRDPAAPLATVEFFDGTSPVAFDATSLPLSDRHGFLLNFTDPAVTAKAQSDALTFLGTGALP